MPLYLFSATKIIENGLSFLEPEVMVGEALQHGESFYLSAGPTSHS